MGLELMEKDSTLFKEIAARIELIDHGILKKGERIPSILIMSDFLGVGINTVKEACSRLEWRHYIECVPQSPFYVLKNLVPKSNDALDEEKIDPLQVSICRICGAFRQKGPISFGLELALARSDAGTMQGARDE
jgi:DNA-binding transcriptional regulator YhcF (GntR family)